MTDKKSSKSRRKLLKSLAAGSGAIIAGKSLPESWTKPVVDSVMLPAHAQTSGIQYFSENLMVENSYGEQDSLHAELLNTLVPTAEAAALDGYYICIKIIGSVATVAFSGQHSTFGTYNMIRRGDIALNGDMKGEGTITATIPQDVSPVSSCQDYEGDDDALTRPFSIDASNPDFVEFGIGSKYRDPIYKTVNKSVDCAPEPTLNGDCT